MSKSERPPIEPLSDVSWARVEQRVWRELDTEATPRRAAPRVHRSWWLAAPLTAAAILFVVLFAPVLTQWFFSIVFWCVDLSGVPGGLVAIGSQLTRFWSAWF